jgi:hypothetical protein
MATYPSFLDRKSKNTYDQLWHYFLIFVDPQKVLAEWASELVFWHVAMLVPD